MTAKFEPNRVVKGVPTGGQFDEKTKTEPDAPAIFNTDYERARFDLLRQHKYVPADRVTISSGTSSRTWWNQAATTGEFDGDGGFRRMSTAPDNVGSMRQRYKGKDFALTMPSVTSVRRMAGTLDKGEPFDIPVSVPNGDGTETMGHVRVRKNSDGTWDAQPLGNVAEKDQAALGAGVKSMLEARRVTGHLDNATKKEMLADFRETRRQNFAKRSVPVTSGWVDSVGFDEGERQVLMTTKSGLSYRYPFGKDIQRALIDSPAPGKFINETMKGSGEVRVDECMSCHRSYTNVGTHQCPAAKRKDGPTAGVRAAAAHLAKKHAPKAAS